MTQSLSVTVRLFARARDLAESDAITVDVPAPATVGDLRQTLLAVLPALRDLLPRCALAVNGDFAGDDVLLSANAEVALLPPVSGG